MSKEFVAMTLTERHAQVESYLGKVVSIEIDRPIGYVHRKGEKTLVYPSDPTRSSAQSEYSPLGNLK